MRRLIAPALLASALVVGATVAPAEAREAYPVRTTDRGAHAPVIGVQGDSISEVYNDRRGDAMRAWWSILGEKKRATVKVDAIGGSGFGIRGKTCTQPSFRERLGRVRKMRADVLVVEGGRNDANGCKAGVRGWATKREQRDRIRLYFRDLRRTVKASKIKRVYVVTVWGPKDRDRRDTVVRFTKRYAERAGFRFKLVKLRQSETYDGVHPNYRGSVKIAKRLLPIVKTPRR